MNKFNETVYIEVLVNIVLIFVNVYHFRSHELKLYFSALNPSVIWLTEIFINKIMAVTNFVRH